MTNRDMNPSQGFGNLNAIEPTWETESQHWRTSWQSRPYATADRGFEYYEPGYRYGVESATRFRGRRFDEVEDELRTGYDRYEHRGESKWEQVKDAVRDAWERVTSR